MHFSFTNPPPTFASFPPCEKLAQTHVHRFIPSSHALFYPLKSRDPHDAAPLLDCSTVSGD
jgi:hypothetical protein